MCISKLTRGSDSVNLTLMSRRCWRIGSSCSWKHIIAQPPIIHTHTHPVLMKFRLCYYVTFKNTPKQKIKKSKMMLNLCDVKRMHALRHCWCKRLPLSNLRLWLQFTSTDTAANHHTRFLSWNWQFSALVIYHCNVSKRYGKWKTTVFKIKCPLTQEEM